MNVQEYNDYHKYPHNIPIWIYRYITLLLTSIAHEYPHNKQLRDRRVRECGVCVCCVFVWVTAYDFWDEASQHVVKLLENSLFNFSLSLSPLSHSWLDGVGWLFFFPGRVPKAIEGASAKMHAAFCLSISHLRQTNRQTDRQAGRQAGRQADRQTDRQTEDRQTDRQTDRQKTDACLRLSASPADWS